MSTKNLVRSDLETMMHAGLIHLLHRSCCVDICLLVALELFSASAVRFWHIFLIVFVKFSEQGDHEKLHSDIAETPLITDQVLYPFDCAAQGGF